MQVLYVLTFLIWGPGAEQPTEVSAGLLLNSHICQLAADSVQKDFEANGPEGARIETICSPQPRKDVAA